MVEVAAAVGVTKPLLYNYFGNKEGLYQACMTPASEALAAAVMEAVESTSTPQEALRSGIHAFFAFVDDGRPPPPEVTTTMITINTTIERISANKRR